MQFLNIDSFVTFDNLDTLANFSLLTILIFFKILTLLTMKMTMLTMFEANWAQLSTFWVRQKKTLDKELKKKSLKVKTFQLQIIRVEQTLSTIAATGK